MSHVPSRVVVGVDDDFRMRESMASLLESAGYEALMFESAEEFLGSGSLARAGCVVTDVRMRGMDGLQLLRRIRIERPSLPVILITAHNHEGIRRLALERGATCFMYKPFDPADLLLVIERVLHGPPVE